MFKKIREVKYIIRLYKILDFPPLAQGLIYGMIRNDAAIDLLNGKISSEFYKEIFTIPLDSLVEMLSNKNTK